ncbi:ABC transporter ATP-binding protein [Rhodohalobacter sulfatireducens]|uniref:ABC transporter ATP-binding protein n=1 Tax=Rhodohalobacter sulfatireducens TaxID=2911366 RepID=A0ABS9KIG4_9BACT|nr:ABC transporter ATP-binding protein [Rhodohalobacter sulfatireducens]MCG2590643.1 ABC transporter ATP-binding protein [Rhodohalobacter sulfatireducens]
MNNVVEISEVSKSYEDVKALKEISFEVEKGELFGLIGPDGAGKTTLFRILTTLLVPDSGEAKVLGMDVVENYREIRPILGYMPGRFSLYQDLSVEENIRFFASVFGTTLEENYDLVKPIYQQLEPFKNRLAGALSGGMKQKLALSCALIHKPELLILDEPTTGVDAVSRKEFWEMLHLLKHQGITILASTPYMDEADQCDRVALMQNGKILKISTPDEVAQSFSSTLYGIRSKHRFQLIQVLREYQYVKSVQPFGESVHYADHRNDPDTDDILRYLSTHGVEDAEIKKIDSNIEDTFMELMQQEESHA